MGFTTTTPATVYPVTVAEAKTHCRVDFSEDDDWFEDQLIPAAAAYVEEETHCTLLTTTYTQTWPRFPTCPDSDGFYSLVPYRPPLISVTTLKYIASDGTLTTLQANTDYVVDSASRPGRIMPAYGVAWPVARCVHDGVQLVYTAGFGAAATSLPKGVRQACLLLIGHWYRLGREAVLAGTISKEIEFGVKALLAGTYMPNPEGF